MAGKTLWHRNAMCPVADMAVSASGNTIMLAGLGMGVLRFGAEGNELVPWATPEPVTQVSVTADGRKTLAVSASGTIWLIGPPQPPREVCAYERTDCRSPNRPLGRFCLARAAVGSLCYRRT
ncbi:MAG: hypothetical protein R3C10_16140 [Pirellulales bacterium]